MNPLLRTRLAILFLMGLAIGVAASRLSLAGKPSGGGETPGGRIYYRWGLNSGLPPYYEDRGDWSMNADGSDKQPAYLPDNAWDLSHAMHQGHRWFLESGFSLTNPGYGALFAVRDDGNPDFTVQLVDMLDWSVSRWAKDDSFISFQAFDANGVDQIWAADIAFDNETGLPALTASPMLIVAEPEAVIINHDFSPLGDEVVLQLRIGGTESLFVKDLIIGATHVLAERGDMPAWSPDGAYIAFRVIDAGIHVIRPDGTGLRQLTSSNVGDYVEDWSPDSRHIAIRRLLRKNGPDGTSIYSSDVLRVSVPEGGMVNLTKDIDGAAGARFWRQ